MVRYTKRDSRKILKQVARLRGISVSEVREELEIAIEEAKQSRPRRTGRISQTFRKQDTYPRRIFMYRYKQF